MPENEKLRQPWEEGIFKDIFGDASDEEWPVQLSRAELPVAPLHSEVVMTSAASAHSPAALIQRKTAMRSWAQTGHAARDRAVQRWRLIIMTNPRASDVGRNLLREATTEVPVGNQQLEDVFATKATSTLAKRAGPIL
eukprot:6365311-Amphidinium_carterae.1